MAASDDPADWAPSPHVTARDTDEGAILLHMGNGRCWEMNRTGAAMWNLLVEVGSARAAIARIGGVLHAAPERAQTDMTAFIEQLATLGMVVRAGAADAP